MVKYKNLSGASGISSYENGSDYIKVAFSDGSVYLYNYTSAGKLHIEKMKSLAINGSGLNSYININVKKSYASKLR